MPIYTPPSFNLVGNIWTAYQALTGTAPYAAPAIPPNVVSPCQLYISPKNTGTVGEYWYATMAGTSHWTDHGPGTSIRWPAGTDVRMWLPNMGVARLYDVAEVPAGSGRFYIVYFVDDVHKGMTNEYRVSYCAMYLFTGVYPMP